MKICCPTLTMWRHLLHLFLFSGWPAELADHRDVIFYGFDIIYLNRRMGNSAPGHHEPPSGGLSLALYGH